jgi:hypothetical protein
MSHSKTCGWGWPPTPQRACSRAHPGHFAIDGASWLAFAVGVANNEDAGTRMGSSNISGVNP